MADEVLTEVRLKDGTALHVRKPKSVYLLDLASTDGGDGLAQIRAARAFMDAAIIEVDREALYDRVYAPDDPLELDEMLADLMPKLIEAVVNRPTTPSSPSSTSRNGTGRASTGRARSRASTPSISPSPA
jgi:hypothetical protein